jgi:hypothetical protein
MEDMEDQSTVRLPRKWKILSARWIAAFPIGPSGIANTSSRSFGMAGEIVLDTGALVSVLVDRRQRFHGVCARFFRASEAQMATTEAVRPDRIHL